MIDVYLLYGAPGVGKGTVSKKLPAAHILGTGNLLRAQKMGLDGQLVSDDYVNQLVDTELKKYRGYVVLDGYPRTATQADYLLSMDGVRLKRVFELSCPDAELIGRLSQRQSCKCGASYHPTLKPSKIKGKCDLCGEELFRRKDDSPEIIQKRLDEYHKITEPVLKKFGEKVQQIDVSNDFNSGIQKIVDTILSDIKSIPVPTQNRNFERE